VNWLFSLMRVVCTYDKKQLAAGSIPPLSDLAQETGKDRILGARVLQMLVVKPGLFTTWGSAAL
jgi:hypothetical protein